MLPVFSVISIDIKGIIKSKIIISIAIMSLIFIIIST